MYRTSECEGTDFHKQLELARHFHDQEIAQLRQSHDHVLWVAREENKTLQEDIALLEALVPKDFRRKASCTTRAPKEALVKPSGNVTDPVQLVIDVPYESSSKFTDTIQFSLGDVSSQELTPDITHQAPASLDAHGREVSSEPETVFSSEGAASCNDIELVETADAGPCTKTLSFSLDSVPFEAMDSDAIFVRTQTDRVRSAHNNWYRICSCVQVIIERQASRLHPMWLVLQSPVSFQSLNSDENSHEVGIYSEISRRANRKSLSDRADSLVNLARMTTTEYVNQNSQRMMRSDAFVMAPHGRYRLMWDLCSVLWCFHDFVIFPVQLINQVDASAPEKLLNLLTTVFWTVDIAMAMSTGYYAADGTVEMRRSRVLLHYAKTWLAFDLSVVLTDWVAYAFSRASFSVMGILRMTRMVRIVRLIRAVRLLPKVWASIGQINSELIFTTARLIHHIVLIILVNHYIACVLWGTWSEIGADEEPIHAYLRSLHWALSHSTLGSMDIVPQNEYERLWTCVILVSSMVLFSTFLSSITNAIAHLGSLRTDRRRQENTMRQFFVDNHISRNLTAQIWNYIWRYDALGKMRTRTTEVELFMVLPNRLRIEIKHRVFLPFLMVHPLFQKYNQIEPEALVMLCSEAIEETMLRPTEELSCDLDSVQRMLMVVSGSLEYHPGWRLAGMITIRTFQWACEEALWSRAAKLMGSMNAGMEGADLILLVPERFRDIAKRYPLSTGLLACYAKAFIASFNAASLDETCMDLLYNDHETIEQIVESAQEDVDKTKIPLSQLSGRDQTSRLKTLLFKPSLRFSSLRIFKQDG